MSYYAKHVFFCCNQRDPNADRPSCNARGASKMRDYAKARISYTKFDAGSEEEFKLGGSRPKSVSGGTMKWDGGRKVLIVKANSKTVSITLE